MAMNMPTHIIAKPIQVRIMVLREPDGSKVPKISLMKEGRIFRPNANCQHRSIG